MKPYMYLSSKNFLKHFPLIAGASTMAVGLMVMLGWVINNSLLVQIDPSYVPMQFNTALCFFISGAALVSLTRKRSLVATVSGTWVCLFGIITLIEYASGVDLGVDQIFITHNIIEKTPFPGRMGANTALAFILVGIALISHNHFLHRNKGVITLQTITILIIAFGVISQIGYAMNLEAAYFWKTLSGMAWHTSLTFIVLGIGLAAKLLSVQEGIFINKLSIWVATAVFLMVVLVFITIWEKLNAYNEAIIKSSIQEQLKLLKEVINNNVQESVIAQRRMAQRWRDRKAINKNELLVDARNYVRDLSSMTAIEWVDQNYRVRLVEPVKGNEKAINLDIQFNDERKSYLRGAAENGRVTLTPPLDLIQGYRAFISYVPIYTGKQFQGFIVGIHSTENFIRTVIPENIRNYFDVTISVEGKSFQQDKRQFSSLNKWEKTETTALFNKTWKITIRPSQTYLDRQSTRLPEIALSIGILLALALSFAWYLTVTLHLNSKHLEKQSYELNIERRRFETILETAADGIFLIDRHGIIISVSRAATKIFGYTEQELLGNSIDMLVASDSRRKHAQMRLFFDGEIAPREMAAGREVMGVCKDGTEIAIEVSLNKTKVLIDGDYGIVAIARDITERKEIELRRANAESALKQTKVTIETIDSFGDGYWDWNISNSNVYMSPRFWEMFGYDHTEMDNHLSAWQSIILPEDRETLRRDFRQHIIDRRKNSYSAEVRYRHKDGTIITVMCRGRIVEWDAEGKAVRMVGTHIDITERKQIENERERFIAKLEESNRDLDEFAYAASHDLQAPLRGIENISKWIEQDLEENIDDTCRENMQLLRNRVGRMKRLLNDLLQYSRVSRKMDDRHTKEVTGKEIIDNILALLSPGENFQIKISPDFEETQFNQMPLQQLLQNLIDNAIKHHDKEKGTIELTLNDLGEEYEISVIDDGPGIAPRYHDRIFNIFQTLKSRDSIESSGIGLAIVRKIITSINGTISIVSEQGEGCRFILTLPKNTNEGEVEKINKEHINLVKHN